MKAASRLALVLDNQPLFWIAVLLSILPLWVTRYPPFVDVPQHAAQITAFRELLAGNPLFTELFELNWFTPYLFGYFLLFVLSLAVPIIVAVKLLLSLAIVSTVLCSRILLREAGADQRLVWLVIPSTYSFALYWGMVNYVVATPCGILFLTLTIRFNRHANPLNGLLVAGASLALFFCHVMALGFATVISMAYIAGANYRNMRALAVRCVPYLAPAPLSFAWLDAARTAETADFTTTFGYGIDRVAMIFSHLSGFDYWSSPVSLSTAAVVILFPFLARARFDRRPERWSPFLAGSLIYLLFPSAVAGIAFLQERLGVFLCLLWVMMWNVPARASSKWHRLPMLVLVLWISANVVRFEWFDAQTRDFARVLAAAEPENRMLSLPVQNRRRHFKRPVYLHLPLWYQVTRSGVVDVNFANLFNQIVRYRSDRRSSIPPGFEWKPNTFRWENSGGEQYDYFLVCADRDVSDEIFKDHRKLVTLRAQSGWWWLYENTAPQEGR